MGSSHDHLDKQEEKDFIKKHVASKIIKPSKKVVVANKMTKVELEKQLRKCERLLKKYTKCKQCNGTGKFRYEEWQKLGPCYACHSSGTVSCELAAYWGDRKSKK